jgi:hypothetical protein
LLDTEERKTILSAIDQASCYTEGVIQRYDRNGPVETQSELQDMEAVIRMATKYPEQFKTFDTDGIKKVVASQKKKVAA